MVKNTTIDVIVDLTAIAFVTKTRDNVVDLISYVFAYTRNHGKPYHFDNLTVHGKINNHCSNFKSALHSTEIKW